MPTTDGLHAGFQCFMKTIIFQISDKGHEHV